MRVSFLLAPVVLALSLPAQKDNPLAPATAPVVVPEATPEERIKMLEDQLARLRAEFDKLEQVEKTGGLSSRVKGALADRQVIGEAIADPHPRNIEMPQAQTQRKARLLTEEEKTELGADVVFTVDGKPATQQDFEAALAYLKSYPNTRSDEDLKQQAVLELIRWKAAEAAFPDTAGKARQRIDAIQAELREGKDFAELAKEKSDCPSSQQGGDLGEFGRVGMDFWFTKAAYELKVGDVSEVIPSTFGYHLIKVTGFEKGENPSQDKVKASHILALYSPNQSAVRGISQRVHGGRAELAFASEEYLNLAPQMYR